MRIFLSACAIFLAACSGSSDEAAPAQPVADPDTRRDVAQGALIGYRSEEGVNVWLNVPFAAAPEGDLRWRAPRPAPSWEGEREALVHGPRCAQMSNVYDRPEGIAPGQVVGDEDCLHLNIYAPRDAEDAPVMVWIHGGGNVWGKASSYDPGRLVANEDVVVITIQYRVGPLGWFAHEAIREGAETDLDRSANFGILDQIAALEWVRDNVSVFGGDPDRVTIFGESAGGHNVSSLLAAPQAKGLFHNAILQSGSFDSYPTNEAENGSARATNSAAEVADRLGATTANGLRAASLEELFGAYNFGEYGFMNLPTIVADDPVIPTPTLREAFGDPSTFNAVPIITGTNKDEMKLFQVLDPRFVNSLFGVLIWPKDRGLYDAASDYQSRLWRLRSVDGPAGRMAAGGHDQVYGYRFDWDDAGRFLVTDLSVLLGAAHAMEIPFVFNRFSFFGDMDRLVFQEKTADDRDTLSRTMGAYWAAFARTGSPNGGGAARPDWPIYTAGGSSSLLRFDAASDGGVAVMTGEETLGAILSDLRSDDRVDDETRCEIAKGLIEWTPQYSDEIAAAGLCD